MGTRHLTVVVLDGKYRVAQYGQWDGYLSGTGESIATLIKHLGMVRYKQLKNNLSTTKFISPKQIKKYWVECGADPNSDFVSIPIGDRFRDKYPALSRDTGCGVLNLLLTKKNLELSNQIDFAKESLFCEWVYVLNFDLNILEIYKGFNAAKVENGERFSGPMKEGYGPVKEIAMIPFDQIDETIMLDLNQFLSKEYV